MTEKQKVIKPLAKIANKPLNKSFVGSRGGFSKEPLAAGGIFARASTVNVLVVLLFFSAISLQAHGIQVKLEKKSPCIVAHARYHGGKALADARVTIAFAEEKTNFQEGSTDRNGNFSFYPDKTGNWIVTVDDRMGHRKKQTVTLEEDFFNISSPPAKIEPAPVKEESGETRTRETRPPSTGEMCCYLLKIVLGVLLILLVTFIIHRWQKRLESRNPKNET